MKRTVRLPALVCIGAITLLSACTMDDDKHSARPSVTPGPTVTTTVPPGAASQLADRYRRSGGTHDVYGIKIQRASGDSDAPLLTVWTRDPDDSAEKLDELKGSITGFLFRDEGLSARQGYFMDVFGPDGSLQHRLDARL
ncbi:hypothetical protein [Streptomyces sp. NPDC001068]|uniref:hypothetical protein n=1 Tax=Streptomyces sp. NPDC001068 TaxID=3364544 RepID=UPI00367DDBD6